jgi:acyl carrier protein
MNDTERRLIRCFTAVFAGLSEIEASSASVDRLAAWDSIATMTLVSLVEEEFDVSVAAAELGGLTSFATFHRYLELRDPRSGGRR